MSGTNSESLPGLRFSHVENAWFFHLGTLKVLK